MTPTPTPRSSWQCDPSGGLACFSDLTNVTMLNAEDGWMVGEAGVVLHYTKAPGQSNPVWQRVDPAVPPFHSLFMVSPTEGWAISFGFAHYKDGTWRQVPGMGGGKDLFMVSPDEGWAVGNFGHISHYWQGQWQEVESPTSEDLKTIFMVGSDEGWASGSNNILLRYQGERWEKVPDEDLPFRSTLIDIEMVSKTEVWALGRDGVFHYKDGVWDVAVDNSSLHLIDLNMINANEGWAVGTEGRIFHYQEGQLHAVESPTQKWLLSVDMVSADEGWAVGEDSTILHYHNGIWSLVSEATPYVLHDLAWPKEGVVWAVGDGVILNYENETWQPVNTPLEIGGALAIDMISPDEGWTVSKAGLAHYKQGNWQLVPYPTSKDILDIDMINANEGWAVGREGAILHYSKGEWREIDSPTQEILTGVSMINEQEGWAVGYHGLILHYHDGRWSPIPPVVDKPIIDQDFEEIQMFNEQEGWILGPYVLLRYHDDIWEEVETNAGLYTMGMLSINEGWITSSAGMIHYKDGQLEIFNKPLGANFSAMLMLNENEGWAVGRSGILHYTNK
jgi:photosystem II stability/assembly factor-like uncharacterized protein